MNGGSNGTGNTIVIFGPQDAREKCEPFVAAKDMPEDEWNGVRNERKSHVGRSGIPALRLDR